MDKYLLPGHSEGDQKQAGVANLEGAEQFGAPFGREIPVPDPGDPQVREMQPELVGRGVRNARRSPQQEDGCAGFRGRFAEREGEVDSRHAVNPGALRPSGRPGDARGISDHEVGVRTSVAKGDGPFRFEEQERVRGDNMTDAPGSEQGATRLQRLRG